MTCVKSQQHSIKREVFCLLTTTTATYTIKSLQLYYYGSVCSNFACFLKERLFQFAYAQNYMVLKNEAKRNLHARTNNTVEGHLFICMQKSVIWSSIVIIFERFQDINLCSNHISTVFINLVLKKDVNC